MAGRGPYAAYGESPTTPSTPHAIRPHIPKDMPHILLILLKAFYSCCSNRRVSKFLFFRSSSSSSSSVLSFVLSSLLSPSWPLFHTLRNINALFIYTILIYALYKFDVDFGVRQILRPPSPRLPTSHLRVIWNDVEQFLKNCSWGLLDLLFHSQCIVFLVFSPFFRWNDGVQETGNDIYKRKGWLSCTNERNW